MDYDSSFPACYYRVAVRAIITNGKLEILMVDEGGLGWTTPGGGLDWNEDPIAGLRRELIEELGCDGEISPLPVMITSWGNKKTDQHLLWLMYQVKLDIQKIIPTNSVKRHCFMTYEEHIESETGRVSDWVCATDYEGDLKKVLI